MALIKYGPAIADARGSVGGTVFSRNSAGAYMKQRTVPTYPGSAKQVLRAALLSTLINDWKTILTPTERDTWNGLASITSLPNRLGEQFSPSGLNLFVKSNFLLDLTSQAHVTAAPVAAIAPAPPLTLAHLVATGIQITDIGNFDTTPTGVLLATHSPNSPLSVNYYKGPWPNLTTFAIVALDTLPVSILGSTSLLINSRVFFRFRIVHDTGAVSVPVIFSADVGAVV